MNDRKLVLFDFDGTLADTKTAGTLALAEFSASRGLPHDAEKLHVGWVDPSMHDLGWGVRFDEQPAILRAFEIYSTEQILNGRFPSLLYDGVKAVLADLAQRYDISVVTARDRASFHAIADYNGVNEYFRLYRSSCCMTERGKLRKPAPDAVHCLLAESGHRSENCVVIGDTTADIDMANAAGVRSIAVLWGGHSAEKLAGSAPTRVIASVAEITKAVEEIFKT